jgi:hypothetical protein
MNKRKRSSTAFTPPQDTNNNHNQLVGPHLTELLHLIDDLGIDKKHRDVWPALLQVPFNHKDDPVENAYKQTQGCNHMMWYESSLLLWCVLQRYVKQVDRPHTGLWTQVCHCVLWLVSVFCEWERNPCAIRLERTLKSEQKWELIPVERVVQMEPILAADWPMERNIFANLSFLIRSSEGASKLPNLLIRIDDKAFWLESDRSFIPMRFGYMSSILIRSKHKWSRDCVEIAQETVKKIRSHLRTILGFPLVLADLCGAYVSLLDWIVSSTIKDGT